MIQDLIRWFFNLLCSYYLYYKLLNLKQTRNSKKILFGGLFLVESFIFTFLSSYIPAIILLIFILINTAILTWACGHFFKPLCLYSFYNLED